MLGRAELLAAVRAALEPHQAVRTLFEGGSASFGRADAYSDIDLVADVAPGNEDMIFAALEEALGALVRRALPDCTEPFLARKIVPVPAWHGMHQRFYKLAGASEWLLLDIALRPADKPELFAETERHGAPQAIFDKDGTLHPMPLDTAAQAQQMAKRRAELREALVLFGNFVEKECHRGRALDALAMYHGMLLRPLVELLRMKHDPARFDYGLRYLDFDLPPDVLARLTPLAYPADMGALLGAQAAAREWIAQLLEALDGAGAEDPA